MDYKTHNSVGILGDEDTINGFMISGIQLDTKNPNLIQVTYNTPEEDLKKMFTKLILRKDLALILVCDFVYEKILEEIKKYDGLIPSIIEIPSKIKCEH
ncbi:hypothetical protein NCER_101494 [Vairimorpha ceranae BRL01]|uniref:Vacuolar atp synthase subunit f n=2 Tax=Vairimorpha ceranae TaxID=40302 RepID=C4VA56_VAIC1|nr:vacuolar atp synthase subunit f [Vairimorpha ceranae]EEQ81897.1 hypothetical protein NCER_101494 [Vairimorpha ceranae BRL01]KAF5140372.1 hypothetical protein G9O61_00g014800 [Vairimorpha ceranae]KKO75442.1 vacuolar atp synthase subunit f [Vairimorpha ceranae]